MTDVPPPGRRGSAAPQPDGRRRWASGLGLVALVVGLGVLTAVGVVVVLLVAALALSSLIS